MENKKRENLVSEFNNLKNRILPYIYPDFKEARLFSKQYHNIILRNIFDNTSIPYAQIYGDGDKIRQVNDLYGQTAGDLALNRLFLDIQSALPDDATISRLGGDEISILIPNANKDDAIRYAKNIDLITHLDSARLKGITITLACSDSSEGTTLAELEAKTESVVESQKHTRKEFISKPSFYCFERLPLEIPSNSDESSKQHWEKINEYINQAIDNYFSDIRPSLTKHYSTTDVLDQSDTLLKAIHDLLYTTDEANASKEVTDSSSNVLESTSTEFQNPEICSLIHSSIVGENMDFLNDLDDATLASLNGHLQSLLENTLTRNSNSGLLNKASLKYDLVDKIAMSPSEYQAIMFSISGIKSSNTAFGHNFTDEKMRKTSDLLIDTFSKNIDFCENLFECGVSDNFLIDKGGGNYLALLSQKDALSKQQLNEYMEEINSHYSPEDPSSIFLLTTACSNDFPEEFPYGFLEKDNIMNDISFLQNECDENKLSAKKITINDIATLVAFKKRIYPAIDFYRKNIPDWDTNVTKQRLFVSNVFRSLINTVICHNKFERKVKSGIPLQEDLEL